MSFPFQQKKSQPVDQKQRPMMGGSPFGQRSAPAGPAMPAPPTSRLAAVMKGLKKK